MASTFAHFDTLIEYDRSLVTSRAVPHQPRAHAVGHSQAHPVRSSPCLRRQGLLHHAGRRRFGLVARSVSARAVRAGRAQAIVVVGAASLFDERVLSLGRAGQLAPPSAHRVFDDAACGTALGEGAAALVLESAPHAAARHREPKAFVTGQASTFAAASDQLDQALARAGRQALAEACLTAANLGLVASGASGVPSVDTGEARALLRLLGHDGQARVTAVKSALGETIDASGLLAAAAALASLGGAPAGPIVGLERPAVPGLRYLTKAEPIAAGHALVTATSQTGACSALVLSEDTQ